VSKKIKLPITPEVLRKIRAQWSTQIGANPDISMLWAAATMCFFGFFRSGEITIPSIAAYDATVHLSWDDVAIDNPTSPKLLRVKLKRSKTDQLGRGAEVFIGRTDGLLCPVSAILSYMAARGSEPGPFFKYQTGCPLTKPKFTQEIRQVLQECGLPHMNFAGHSFRIGAATTAAGCGIEDSLIRKLGRWNSDAFLRYIRLSQEELAQFSRTLAGC